MSLLQPAMLFAPCYLNEVAFLLVLLLMSVRLPPRMLVEFVWKHIKWLVHACLRK
jgi:hypothetical protein